MDKHEDSTIKAIEMQNISYQAQEEPVETDNDLYEFANFATGESETCNGFYASYIKETDNDMYANTSIDNKAEVSNDLYTAYTTDSQQIPTHAFQTENNLYENSNLNPIEMSVDNNLYAITD